MGGAAGAAGVATVLVLDARLPTTRVLLNTAVSNRHTQCRLGSKEQTGQNALCTWALPQRGAGARVARLERARGVPDAPGPAARRGGGLAPARRC